MKIERPIKENDNFVNYNGNVVCTNDLKKILCENYTGETGFYQFPIKEKEVKYYPQCACYKKKDFFNEKIKVMDNAGEKEFIFYRSDYEDSLETRLPLMCFDVIFFDVGFLFIADNDEVKKYIFNFYEEKYDSLENVVGESLVDFIKAAELYICLNDSKYDEEMLTEADLQEIENYVQSEKSFNKNLFKDINNMLTK